MASLDDFGSRLYQYLMSPSKLQRAVPDIEQVIRTSIEDNFRMGGRWGNDNPWGGGSNPWASTANPDETHRILVDTSDLINSIDVNVVLEADEMIIELSARPDYAFFLQEGTKFMPARPFLVIQNEDIEQISEIIAETFLK